MPHANVFLERLPAAERATIESLTHEVDQSAGEVVYATGGAIQMLYFPMSSVSSVVTEMEDGRSVEAATVGREGMIGFTALWGVLRSSHLLLVQVPGKALEVPVADLRDAQDTLPNFRARLGHYAEALMLLMSQSAACLALHPVQERCARWLLMTADRTGASSFQLTHEFLASMLGVHRPTVTIAMGQLHTAGLVDTHRGVVEILDRPELERASCECYGRVKSGFDELLA